MSFENDLKAEEKDGKRHIFFKKSTVLRKAYMIELLKSFIYIRLVTDVSFVTPQQLVDLFSPETVNLSTDAFLYYFE